MVIIEKPIRRMETLMLRRGRAIRAKYKRYLGTLPKVEIERRCLALASELRMPL